MDHKYWALIGIGTSTLILGTGLIFSSISNSRQHKQINKDISKLTVIATEGRQYASNASTYALGAKQNSDSTIVLGNKIHSTTTQIKKNTSGLTGLLTGIKKDVNGLSTKMSIEHEEQDSLADENYSDIDQILCETDSTITEIYQLTTALGESTSTINKNIKKLEKNQYKERRSIFWGFIKY